jgi:2'-5' RNA ligase
MTLRLFAAIGLPDAVAERAASLMHGVGGARWRTREQLHVTLRFFGEVPEPIARDIDSALEVAAARTAPFDLALKGAGHFGGERPHALWLGVAASAGLSALAQRCERAARDAGLAAETRKYTPHATIAYLGAAAALDRVMAFTSRTALFETPPWRVERFGLYSSWPGASPESQYVLEADYPLLG